MGHSKAHPLAYTRANDGGRETTSLTAGVTLNASDALIGNQQTFTRAQVAYLISLAFQSGQTRAASDDIAEAVACWDEFAQPKQTRADRIAARLAEMQAGVEREARRPRPLRVVGDDDWPEVEQPGTADAAYLQRIAEPFICPCDRTGPAWDGGHVTAQPFPKRWQQDRDAQQVAA